MDKENGAIEHLKLDPEDFGGFQTKVLTVEEAAKRYCSRRYCGQPGRVQMMIPGENGKLFRVVCGRHFVMLMVIQSAALGDPSPISEGKRLAEKMGINLEHFPEVKVPQVVGFDSAICSRCGGQAIMETVGMFAGLRWVHTCVTEEEQRAADARRRDQ